MRSDRAGEICVWLAAILVAGSTLDPRPAAAIPAFARIYGKPCGACHTIYPQLNPAGELFRARGLHGIEPVVKPLKVASHVEVPGTLPMAVALGIGEDVGEVSSAGRPSPTTTHFNLEFLAVVAGGELGPHLAFMADYAPLFSVSSTGELKENTRLGLGFLQAHAEPGGWLLNLRAGVFELPLGTSPRVHRLSVQSYMTYSLTAFSLLGVPPPVQGSRSDSLSLGSTQVGVELSGLHPQRGHGWAIGVTSGSNNRVDNNSSKDLFLRLSQGWGLHSAGLFFYYSPDLIGVGAHDWGLRLGPDFNLRHRQVGVRGQLLANYDSNPTAKGEDLWYYGSFLEGEYRFTPTLASLLRVEYAWTPSFDDRPAGGNTHIRRRQWQLTTGAQWLLLENVKLVLEGTYGENREAVTDRETDRWSATLRLQTAFWPLTPPLLERWSPWGSET